MRALSEMQDIGKLLKLSSLAYQSFDFEEELLVVDRLDQVVVRSELETLDPLGNASKRGAEEKRYLIESHGSDSTTKLIAIQLRHEHVTDYELGFQIVEQLHRIQHTSAFPGPSGDS